MTRTTILEANINDKVLSESVREMTHAKNCWSTKALQNLSLNEAHFHERLNLSHLRMLGSTVCVLLYEEQRLMKPEE